MVAPEGGRHPPLPAPGVSQRRAALREKQREPADGNRADAGDNQVHPIGVQVVVERAAQVRPDHGAQAGDGVNAGEI